MINFRSSFVLLISVFSAVLSAQEYVGVGEAVLGNGVPLEKVEEIAQILSQRDAVSKFGVEILSETVIRDLALEKDEITAVASGLVKMLDGSKKVKKKLVNDVFMIEVSAKYKIEKSDYVQNIQKYVQANKGKGELKSLTSEIVKNEKNMDALAKNTNATSVDVNRAINNRKEKIDLLEKAISLDATGVMKNLNSDNMTRLQGLKGYLEELKTLDISKLREHKITVEVKGANEESRARLEVHSTFRFDKSLIKKARNIYNKYKKHFFVDDKDVNRKLHFYAKRISEKGNDSRFQLSQTVLGLSDDNDVLWYAWISDFSPRVFEYSLFYESDFKEDKTESYGYINKDLILRTKRYLSFQSTNVRYEKLLSGAERSEESYIYLLTQEPNISIFQETSLADEWSAWLDKILSLVNTWITEEQNNMKD